MSWEPFVNRVIYRRDDVETPDTYPFCLPVLEGMKEIKLHPKLTYFVGENGSGKSTLLEAIAVAAGFNAEGGTKNFRFATESTESCLHNYLTLVRSARRERDGYFLRAESIYTFASEIDRLDREPGGGLPIKAYYGGISLHQRSHGEGQLAILTHRLGYDSLLIFDEPEAALSPTRQLSLLHLIHELVSKKRCQILMATHSPILMSYPDSLMLAVDQKLQPIDWQETEHYRLTRDFLNNPKTFLHHLLKGPQ